MFLVAGIIVLLDQITKYCVLRYLGYAQEKVIIEGFFKFVHWGNTGAAWSLFRDNNGVLAVVSVVALIILYVTRHHFEVGGDWGKLAMGLLFGGIVGNLIDRVLRHHVIDFIYFYVNPRSGGEVGFPAFNVADSAICTAVFLLFLLSWQQETASRAVAEGADGR